MNLSTAFSNAYTKINEISDPISRGEKWIFSSFPDLNSDDFPSFPIIIIQPFSRNESPLTLKNDTKRCVYTTEILIYSKSASQADSLADSVVSKVEEVSGFNTRLVQGVDSYDVNYGGEIIHVRPVISRGVVYE